MEAKRIALENQDGVVVRSMAWPDWEPDELTVIRRRDSRRLELMTSLDELRKKQIQFETLGVVRRADLAKGAVAIDGVGRVAPLSESARLLKNEIVRKESETVWRGSFLSVILGAALFLGLVFNLPKENKAVEQELKQQVVQIIQRIPVKPQTVPQAVADSRTSTVKETVTTNKSASIKRMGALAVFGSMKSGSQKGGVNLGAVNTTAGPGLGGTAGSGGVQTSIYGKGLVAAPLGVGGNMQGGGGYGTKGKGGGQAGYGQISLVGSAGTSPIPLGREAIIGGGLDRDLIADVINRNLGQVRFCYEQGLQGDPALAGRVAVDFVIGGNGQVKSASVGSTTLNSKVVEDCILLRLKTWKFPLPEGGSDVKVSYPFALRRTGQG
jgi:hypothetical protein